MHAAKILDGKIAGEQLKKAEADFAKTKKQAEQLDVAKKAVRAICFR